SRSVVERARLAGRAEHAHSCLASDVVLPLVRIGMPMQLAHPSWINLHKRGSDRDGRVKALRIDDPHGARSGPDRLLLRHVVTESIGDRAGALNSIRGESAGDGRSKDVELLGV